ncbi:cation diffusion facilitator family transporter [Neobacillus sp. SuZ13]|uniref:cation diffusion facilitator family transporter n=1 Tax=Neobacillus sp. SuZ13 TaxID=3047875 RepID=UPI0024BFAC2D|nr:cation diffusion facilitator family transporter [Neobacillus sp. SuZ13]WHY69725.1 cation diffusion facilitator family transporter [Neobacillus sp. SuZ13]
MEIKQVIKYIKNGNQSSALAMTGNMLIAVIEFIAGAISGSGAMYAAAMHSLGDAVNQGFIFMGSVLSQKKPTKRFPNGFESLNYIFSIIAALVVLTMAIETINEGCHLIWHPSEPSRGLLINVLILVLNLVIDGAVLIKAMKEINEDSRVIEKGFRLVLQSFKNVSKAAPPTRFIFFEDLVSVTSALLAMIAVVFTAITQIHFLDGVFTVIIGLLMLWVSFRVGYDNIVELVRSSAIMDNQYHD